MFSPLDGSMFVLPACYHPSTLLSIDDDEAFSKTLSLLISGKINILCFNDPNEAINYIETKYNCLPFTTRCLVENNGQVELNFAAIRNGMYNRDRFKTIFVMVTDYDMPHVSGIELIKTMKFPAEVLQYAYIILTGKISDEFKGQLAELGAKKGYIGKNDPDYLKKLLDQFQDRTEKIFQWYSYSPARLLSRNQEEGTYFLFDGNFSPIFNNYLKDNNICEFYLFDQQGSYIFLDEEANLSWLFIRNEKGIDKSIKLATRYGAPQSVIASLKSKEVILSLYEKEDFENKKKINWQDYLIPASVFESDDKYLSFFPGLIPNNNGEKKITSYYYAFTDHFPENSVKKENILSYQDFLNEQD